MALYAVCILVGIVAAHWLYKPLAALLRGAVFVAGIYIAYRVTAMVTPLDLDWRGFWSGAGIGTVVLLVFGGGFFYVLGWRGRVAATEADERERARQKAIKDRQVA